MRIKKPISYGENYQFNETAISTIIISQSTNSTNSTEPTPTIDISDLIDFFTIKPLAYNYLFPIIGFILLAIVSMIISFSWQRFHRHHQQLPRFKSRLAPNLLAPNSAFINQDDFDYEKYAEFIMPPLSADSESLEERILTRNQINEMIANRSPHRIGLLSNSTAVSSLNNNSIINRKRLKSMLKGKKTARRVKGKLHSKVGVIGNGQKSSSLPENYSIVESSDSSLGLGRARLSLCDTKSGKSYSKTKNKSKVIKQSVKSILIEFNTTNPKGKSRKSTIKSKIVSKKTPRKPRALPPRGSWRQPKSI